MNVKDRPASSPPRALLGALLAALACACGREEPPDTFALYQRFLGARAIEFRAPRGELEEHVRHLASTLARQERIDVRVVIGEGRREPDLPRIVFALSDEASVEPLALALGIRRLAPRGFAWLGREHRAPTDAIVARAEDPERRGQPLVLVLGNDARALARLVRELPPPWECGFETFKNGEPALEVEATLEGSPVLATLVDHASERERYTRGLAQKTVAGIRFHVPAEVPAARFEAFAAACARAKGRVEGWLGRAGSAGGAAPEVFLYAHPEDLERSLGDAPLAWANPLGSRVHALVAEGVPDDGGAALARATALDLLGEPAEPWMLSGVGAAAAGTWWGRPLDPWVARLEEAGELPPIGELLAEDAPRRMSEHVLVPARGRRFAELASELGSAGLAAAWKSGTHGASTASAPPAPHPRETPPAQSEPTEPWVALEPRAPRAVWRGIAVDDARAGGLASTYGSRAGDGLLARVRDLGASAVSFSVEATLEPHRRTVACLDEIANEGSASDAVLFHATARARALGLATLWRVQPLGAPAGARADAFGLIDAQDQRTFFQRFERLGVHYACLAELADVDVLCLGAGLDSAACSVGLEPDDRRRRGEQWRHAWSHLRPLFDGSWTYASSSLDAAREVEFWDELDLVALESWPAFPASLAETAPEALAAHLRSEIDGARALGEKVGRGVFWIETGFPARDLAWPRPRVPYGAADAESQRRFFEGLRLALQGPVVAPERGPALEPFLGFLVWCVPAAPGAAPAGPYSVLGRPAEGELGRLFGRP